MAAAGLFGCKEGNSTGGHLMLSSGSTGGLARSRHVELLQWKKPVHIRMAPGSSFDVYVGDPETGVGLVVSAARIDADLASAQVIAPGVVRIKATKEGEADLHITSQIDGESFEDAVPVVIRAPNVLEFSKPCSNENYWVGHPAVVRHEFSQSPMSDDARFGGEIYGSGYVPIDPKPAMSLLYENGYEWVFSGLDAPGHATLTGRLAGDSRVMDLKFEPAPKVKDLALAGIWTDGVLGHEFQGPTGGRHIFRVFPVGEDGQQMCNTTAAAQVKATTAGCVVRSLDQDAAFAPAASSQWGVFEVTSSRPIDRCTYEITLGREDWEFTSNEPIRGQISTVFFSAK